MSSFRPFAAKPGCVLRETNAVARGEIVLLLDDLARRLGGSADLSGDRHCEDVRSECRRLRQEIAAIPLETPEAVRLLRRAIISLRLLCTRLVDLAEGPPEKTVGHCNVSENIYIVDDDEDVRETLKDVLAEHGFAPHAFASAREFLSAFPHLPPGCVLSDIRMPGMSGLEVQRLLRTTAPSVPVVLMTAYADVRVAVEAIKSGAFDFIEKPFDSGALCKVLDSAVEGLHMSSEQTPSEVISRVALLSERERVVLKGIVRGQSSKEIARELNLSPRTVESHRARVLQKMQARSTSELVRVALAAGID
jgi:two-component system response regulator FixJ